MCGIYGFVAESEQQQTPDLESFITRGRALATEDVVDAAALASLTEASVDLVAPDVFLALYRQPQVRSELDKVSAGLSDLVTRLEKRIESDSNLDSQHVEEINSTLVVARDLVWRVRKDVLGSLGQVIDLAHAALHGEYSEDAVAAAFTVAWRINLCFNNIDRLEVRGRDSAGVSLQVWLPTAAAVDTVLEALSDREGQRLDDPRLGHRAIMRAGGDDGLSLVFVYKVAEEVGKIGDNVRTLRSAVTEDRVLWGLLARNDSHAQILAHTRWASNGVISIPNCHPIDGAVATSDGFHTGGGRILAVLNGDVDNYRDLKARYATDSAIDQAITTDAKIIPVLIEHHLAATGDIAEAFRLAFAELEGSMAIAVVSSDRPGEILLGQKGSGQGVYLGRSRSGVGISSELYGLVELTGEFVKLEGERVDADGELVGEVVRVRQSGSGVVIESLDTASPQPLPAERYGPAGITTRDIDRGAHEHYMAKEIGESVESVAKTIRGRYDIRDERVVFRFGEDAVPASVVERLRSGKTRRVLGIGQGTAAVASSGVAHLLAEALAGLDIEIDSMRATELSGHHLRADMSDTLVIAVSQSGTTTDTNRTVDLVRQRGAQVLAIVNRRNSDLVFRSDGVIYTSDGRDVEMSVASTKAFYSQNVAGRLLALYLASQLETMSESEVTAGVRALVELQELMRRVLRGEDRIADAAQSYATRRRYWAVVGSGSGRVAADEIRIKLSELCYKSIAVDYLEDKKHIDLSSEPLVFVCAVGLPRGNVSDVVKEVAIFKAHNSVPLVVTEEGEDRFDAYAERIIRVPACHDSMAYLLATMAGHLFGYHAARAFDDQAATLRQLRTHVVQTSLASDDPHDLQALLEPIAQSLVDLGDRLASGELDSCIEVATAVRLGTIADLLLGRLPLSDVRSRFQRQPTIGHLLELSIEVLSQAIGEMSRPIDAIKHQAKTVTVGISRTEIRPITGPLWTPVAAAGHELTDFDESTISFLNALQPLVAEVTGVTRYEIGGLDPIGRPTDRTTIHAIEKTGVAANFASRADEETSLTGAKWVAVKDRVMYLGKGQADGRRILLIPVAAGDNGLELFLYHLELGESGDRSQRLAALRGLPRRHDRLIASVTERNVAWRPELIDLLDNEDLFFTHVDEAAAKIIVAAPPV